MADNGRSVPMGTVLHIYVAAHRGAPMQRLDAVTALEDQGLVGDRYIAASNRRSPDYQITLIQAEHIEDFSSEHAIAFTPDMPRRNIVTRGTSLNDLRGKRFRVGNVLLEGLKLCEPCALFAKRTDRAVLRFFPRKGGLRARIVAGGQIRVGDAIIAEKAPD